MSTMPIAAGGVRNQILAGLPASDLDALRPHLHRVTLSSGQILYETSSPILEVFFVEEGIVLLTADTSDNGQVEVGLTGREGFVGVSVMLNQKPVAVHRAFVQAPGSAYRITAAALRPALERSAELRDRCLRHVETLLIQSAQVAACNARHTLPERLARWLLMVGDGIDGDVLPMTQEFLSVMLGVRRAGVSVAASTLQSAGLIHAQRGRVTIVDRAGLLAASCDCYRIIHQMRDSNFNGQV